MQRTVNDDRDPLKRALGNKIRDMQENNPEGLAEMVSQLSEQEAYEIMYDDEVMLRDKQWINLGWDEDLILVCSGRGFGKTHAGAATVFRAIEKHGVKSIMYIAPTARTLNKSIAPAIISRYPPNHPNKPELKQGFLKYPNGAEVQLIPAEAGEDAPRSANTELLVLEEAAFYQTNEGIITQAELTVRIGIAKTIVLTTPKATPQMIEWMRMVEEGDPTIRLITGSTAENKANLSKKFVDTVYKKYAGTHLEKTELEGILILENEDALFSLNELNASIVDKSPAIIEYCIGVDPALISKQGGAGRAKNARKPDSTGIVVSGMGEDGIMYTVANHSGSYSPEKWAAKVSNLYDQFSEKAPTKIIVETNVTGTEMIEMNFRNIERPDVARHFKPEFSTASKLARASSYALLFEQGKIKWVDGCNVSTLFQEMSTFTGKTSKSPDQMDAQVFSWMGLSPTKKSFTRSYELLI